MPFKPLRPELYHGLRRHCGEVRVLRPGQPVVTDQEHFSVDGRDVFRVHDWGETYCVCCPFCDDRRFRLTVSHAWGSVDENTGMYMYRLARCWNEEDCMEDRDNRLDLADRIFVQGMVEDVTGGRFCSDVHTTNEVDVTPVVPVMPGAVVPLHTLGVEHPANVFLASRGFDPIATAETWQLGYCTRARAGMSPATNRIIIPAIVGDRMAGWQARSVGSPAPGQPKYWSMPGSWKSNVLYGIDQALSSPWVCVVEGPTDVWRLAGKAVGLLGHSLSYWQLKALVSVWCDGVIIVVLDADVRDKASALVRRLSNASCRRVLSYDMPMGVDPSDLDRSVLLANIVRHAKDQGVDLESMDVEFARGPGPARAAARLAGHIAARPGLPADGRRVSCDAFKLDARL